MAANLRKVGYNTKKIILFYCPTMNIFLLKSHKFITFFIENDGGLKFCCLYLQSESGRNPVSVMH